MEDAFGDRMAGYASAAETVLPRRLPVIIRLDGDSFSSWTKQQKFVKPFDERMSRAMVRATRAVCDYFGGALFGYTQSDEISILARNDQSHEADPFLGNRTQKIVSLCASLCTASFNLELMQQGLNLTEPATFDCRVFILPPEEVVNYFLWRQRDAYRNCVGSLIYWKLGEKVGRSKARDLASGATTEEREALLLKEGGIDVATVDTRWKHGVGVRKDTRAGKLRDLLGPEKVAKLEEMGGVNLDQEVLRGETVIDTNLPNFGEDRDYVGRMMRPFEEIKADALARVGVKAENKT